MAKRQDDRLQDQWGNIWWVLEQVGEFDWQSYEPTTGAGKKDAVYYSIVKAMDMACWWVFVQFVGVRRATSSNQLHERPQTQDSGPPALEVRALISQRKARSLSNERNSVHARHTEASTTNADCSLKPKDLIDPSVSLNAR